MEYQEFSARTVDDAITEACEKLEVVSSDLDYEIIFEGSGGFLGMGAKRATIRARIKEVSVTDEATSTFDIPDSNLCIDLSGENMGVLIGKRGQTLDSLQYLVSLVVNKDTENYIHVKLDTENYRERRKATLENLAKNVAYKVKRTKRSVSLEPMNPYERRIIHSVLQADHYVTTHSEGDEPFRKVVVTLKK